MIKSAVKLFSLAFGTRAGAEKSLRPSQTCPECGSNLLKSVGWGERPREPVAATQAGSPGVSPHLPTNWFCPNPDCPAQVRRALVHWCGPDVMDIAGGDAALVAKLVGQGLARDVAELYRIKVAELAALEGLDKDAAPKFFAAVTASTKRDAWRLLFGLKIPLVGMAEAQALGRGFPTVDAVFAAGGPRLMKDGGVSEAVAQSIVRWHSDSVNRRLVKRLEKLGLNFKSELYRAAPAKMSGA